LKKDRQHVGLGSPLASRHRLWDKARTRRGSQKRTQNSQDI